MRRISAAEWRKENRKLHIIPESSRKKRKKTRTNPARKISFYSTAIYRAAYWCSSSSSLLTCLSLHTAATTTLFRFESIDIYIYLSLLWWTIFCIFFLFISISPRSSSIMSLSSKDINLILNLLNEDTCGSLWTFDQIAQQFQQGISKSDYLRVGNALVLLLQNRDLTPTIPQRLIIFFLFIIMHPSNQSSVEMNPFAPVFLSVLQSDGENSAGTKTHFHWMIPPVTRQERSFVLALLNQRLLDIVTKTPNQILQNNIPFNDPQLEKESEQQLRGKLQGRKQQWPACAQCHLPAVINDPEINQVRWNERLSWELCSCFRSSMVLTDWSAVLIIMPIKVEKQPKIF